MKLLKLFTLFAVSLLLLTACNTKKEVVRETTVTTVNTSTKEKVTIQDTTLKAPAAQTKLIVPLKDLKEGLSKKSKDRQAGLNLNIKNGNLEADCTCDTVAILAKLQHKETTTIKDSTTETTRPVFIKFIPKWVKVFAWIGAFTTGLFLLFIVGFIIYKYKGK